MVKPTLFIENSEHKARASNIDLAKILAFLILLTSGLGLTAIEILDVGDVVLPILCVISGLAMATVSLTWLVGFWGRSSLLSEDKGLAMLDGLSASIPRVEPSPVSLPNEDPLAPSPAIASNLHQPG